MPIRVSRRTALCVRPPIAEVDRKISMYSGALPLINLSQGAPNYPPPPAISEAMGAALQSPTHARYTERAGRRSTRASIVTRLDTIGMSVDVDDVLVTSGANEAFCCAVGALTDPGDSVIVPTPHYFNHSMWLEMMSVEVRYVDTSPAWIPSAESILAAADSTTKAVVLTSPCNPTGCETQPVELMRIVNLCDTRGIAVLIDLTYASFGSDGLLSALGATSRDNVVIIAGYSKEYAIPGYRIGALAASRAIIEQAAKVHDCISICAPALAQVALEVALGECDEWRDAQTNTIASRRRHFMHLMQDDPGGFSLESVGGFFAWVRHPSELSSAEVADDLLYSVGLAVLPGSLFYPFDDKYLRISVANVGEVELGEVVHRLVRYEEGR